MENPRLLNRKAKILWHFENLQNYMDCMENWSVTGGQNIFPYKSVSFSNVHKNSPLKFTNLKMST